jgi:hypothetical protein
MYDQYSKKVIRAKASARREREQDEESAPISGGVLRRSELIKKRILAPDKKRKKVPAALFWGEGRSGGSRHRQPPRTMLRGPRK